MEEKKTTWNDAEKLVSGVLKDNQKQAKRWFVAFVITMAALIGTNAYWIHQWSSYDYVSQGGEGYNYFNSNIDGDISNGAED